MFRNVSTYLLRFVAPDKYTCADFKTTFPCFPQEANENDTYLVTPTIDQLNSPPFKALFEFYKDWIVWQSPACHNLVHPDEKIPRVFLYVLEKPKKD
jgi:hypothetical protein